MAQKNSRARADGVGRKTAGAPRERRACAFQRKNAEKSPWEVF